MSSGAPAPARGFAQARSFFPRTGFRKDFGEGTNRLLPFVKALPRGGRIGLLQRAKQRECMSLADLARAIELVREVQRGISLRPEEAGPLAGSMGVNR